MVHRPIQIKNLSFSFPHKTCFDGFNAQISYGARIAIIGRNGSGKTTLLKILYGTIEPTSGIIQRADDAVFGFVPQIIEGFDSLSGSQRLNKAITKSLSLNPNVLLLDEPTNHLDSRNRKSLMRMLQTYSGTLMVVSHDIELLQKGVDTIWDIEGGKIQVFSGCYNDYLKEKHVHRTIIEQALSRLNRQKKEIHYALMKEQERAAKRKAKGQKSIHQRKWPTVVSGSKAGRAEETSGRYKSEIEHKKQNLIEKLSHLCLPEVIKPKFSITAASISDRAIVTIRDGCVGYVNREPLLQKINLSVGSRDRIAILGDNASGKSTLIKAILNDVSVIKSGSWSVPQYFNMGYLDQHYATLSVDKTVYDTIAELAQNWTRVEVRRHLNDFLFSKNEEVNLVVAELSGGEKARLSLAQIASKTPKLLILDEITNNLDLETREYVIEVLKHYPGALIIIAHDDDFLRKVGVQDRYCITEGLLSRIGAMI